MRSGLALAAVLVAACQPAGSATPTASPIATLGPQPTATEALMDLVVSETEALAPARYVRPGFEPRMTFAVEAGTGWYAIQGFEGFFDIQHDVGSPDVTAVQFARPDAAFGAGGNAVSLVAAADLPAILETHPGLAVVAVDISRIGGLDGTHMTVEHAGGEDAVAVLRVPPGPLSILPGRALWIAAFDTPEGVLAIIVGASIAQFDASLALAEPILDSIVIE